MDFQLPQNVVCRTESKKPDLSATLAKSLICQQNSTFFLGYMPLLCSRQTPFLQFHALACLPTLIFNLFSNTAEEEAWEVAVASWAPIRWTPSLCFTGAYEHIAAAGKIIQSLPIWSRS